MIFRRIFTKKHLKFRKENTFYVDKWGEFLEDP